MKKYMLAAVLSVLLLTAACSKEETKTADAKTSSVLSDSETEASDHADGKSEIEKEADEAAEKVSEIKALLKCKALMNSQKRYLKQKNKTTSPLKAPLMKAVRNPKTLKLSAANF